MVIEPDPKPGACLYMQADSCGFNRLVPRHTVEIAMQIAEAAGDTDNSNRFKQLIAKSQVIAAMHVGAVASSASTWMYLRTKTMTSFWRIHGGKKKTAAQVQLLDYRTWHWLMTTMTIRQCASRMIERTRSIGVQNDLHGAIMSRKAIGAPTLSSKTAQRGKMIHGAMMSVSKAKAMGAAADSIWVPTSTAAASIISHECVSPCSRRRCYSI